MEANPDQPGQLANRWFAVTNDVAVVLGEDDRRRRRDQTEREPGSQILTIQHQVRPPDDVVLELGSHGATLSRLRRCGHEDSSGKPFCLGRPRVEVSSHVAAASFLWRQRCA